jgi:MYXO-CTERM domain-containing protein
VTTDPTAPSTDRPKASAGGCSVGGGSSENALWLLGLGAVAVFRRRRQAQR